LGVVLWVLCCVNWVFVTFMVFCYGFVRFFWEKCNRLSHLFYWGNYYLLRCYTFTSNKFKK